MKPQRPVPITVLGVLCLLMGGFGVVVALTGLAVAGRAAPSTSGDVLLHPLAYLRANTPGYRAYETGLPVAFGVAGAAFLVAGAGLLGARAGARKLAAATAGLALTGCLVFVLYEVGVVLPAFEDWRRLPTDKVVYRTSPGVTHHSRADEAALNLIPIARLTAVLFFALHGLIVVTVLLSPASRADEPEALETVGDSYAPPHRA